MTAHPNARLLGRYRTRALRVDALLATPYHPEADEAIRDTATDVLVSLMGVAARTNLTHLYAAVSAELRKRGR